MKSNSLVSGGGEREGNSSSSHTGNIRVRNAHCLGLFQEFHRKLHRRSFIKLLNVENRGASLNQRRLFFSRVNDCCESDATMRFDTRDFGKGDKSFWQSRVTL